MAALAAIVLATAACNPAGAAALAPQPMELQGKWLGLELAPTSSVVAQQAGIPPNVMGVVVANVTADPTARGRQAGILAGDVISSVDGKPVGTLAELYTVSTKLDPVRPVPVDILRAGQPMRVLMPPSAGAMASAVRGTAPGAMVGGVAGAMGQVMPAAPMATVPGVGAPLASMPSAAPEMTAAQLPLMCPNDGTRWAHSQVQPGMTCPRCGTPLVQ